MFTFVLYPSLTQAQVTEDLPAAKDNTLFQDATGALSNGAGSHIFAGSIILDPIQVRRALLQFDIAGSIPAGSTITDVVLQLNMSRTIAASFDVSLHHVNADWGEGTSQAPGQEGAGDPSATDDATWIHRFFSTSEWTTPGGDFEAGASATTAVDGLGAYEWGSTAGMVADVQGWLDSPSTDFGWIVLGDETVQTTAKRFDSRENPVAANRPVLSVTYTPPSFPIQSNLSPAFIEEGALLQLTAPDGGSYQWKKDGSNVSDGGNISGSNAQTLVFDTVLETDEGTYTAEFDTSGKAVVETEPFVLAVLPAGSVPGANAWGLTLLTLLVLLAGVSYLFRVCAVR